MMAGTEDKPGDNLTIPSNRPPVALPRTVSPPAIGVYSNVVLHACMLPLFLYKY